VLSWLVLLCVCDSGQKRPPPLRFVASLFVGVASRPQPLPRAVFVARRRLAYLIMSLPVWHLFVWGLVSEGAGDGNPPFGVVGSRKKESV
jgi:hypothetical protein